MSVQGGLTVHDGAARASGDVDIAGHLELGTMSQYSALTAASFRAGSAEMAMGSTLDASGISVTVGALVTHIGARVSAPYATEIAFGTLNTSAGTRILAPRAAAFVVTRAIALAAHVETSCAGDVEVLGNLTCGAPAMACECAQVFPKADCAVQLHVCDDDSDPFDEYAAPWLVDAAAASCFVSADGVNLFSPDFFPAVTCS